MRHQKLIARRGATTRDDLTLVLSCALAARVLVPIVALVAYGGDDYFQRSDSIGYLRLASQLADCARFGSSEEAEIVRTPGYPLFMTLGLLVDRPVAVTIALQILLGALSSCGVYMLARSLADITAGTDSRTVALGAGLFHALDPLSAVHSSLLLSETLFTTLLILHLQLMVRYYQSGALRYANQSALALAAGTLVRPASYYWPFIVAALLLFIRPVPWLVRPPVARVGPALLFLLISIGPPVLWQARNLVQAGYSGYSAIRETNLYSYIGASMEARSTGEPWTTVRARRNDRLNLLEKEHRWTRAERYGYMRRDAMLLIAERPVTYLTVHAAAILETLAPTFSNYVLLYDPDFAGLRLIRRLMGGHYPPPGEFLTALPTYLLVGLACMGQYLLALIGLRRILPTRNGGLILVLAATTYFLLIAGGAAEASSDRFRHPVMPIICLLAGFGASQVWTNRTATQPPASTSA